MKSTVKECEFHYTLSKVLLYKVEEKRTSEKFLRFFLTLF